MKLTFFAYPLQLRHTFAVASHSRTMTPDVQVQITHEGITGYGEASMPPYLGETAESVMAFLQKVDLAQFSDPLQLDEILAYIDGIAPDNTAAKASIDIALHDLKGKLLGAPCWQFLECNTLLTSLPASSSASLSASSSLRDIPPTTYTIGIDTPEVMQRKVCEVAGQFRRLKVKVGTDADREHIQAIRTVSDLPLTVDANQGWTDKHHALDTIHWFKEQGAIMVEQPMPKEQLDDLAWLTQHSPLPIFADESIKRLSDISCIAGAFHGINIKLMKSTGLHEAVKMRQLAESLGLQTMLGCMTETSCAVAAAAALSIGIDYADLDGHLLITNDRFTGLSLTKGRILPGNNPGLGLSLTSS